MARLPRRAVGEGRPRPPAEWLERTGQSGLLQLQPAPELLAWALDSIVAGSGPVNNPDHVHLADADLAFAWASTGFQKAGRAAGPGRTGHVPRGRLAEGARRAVLSCVKIRARDTAR